MQQQQSQQQIYPNSNVYQQPQPQSQPQIYPNSGYVSPLQNFYQQPTTSPYLASNLNLNSGPVILSINKPLWNTSKEGLKCSKCLAEFTFFKRRHHCRCCFREYCDSCSQKQSKVALFGHLTPVRVCDPCFKHLSKSETVCLSKLVPYFTITQPEMVKAIKEFYDIVIRLSDAKDTTLIEELIQISCVTPLLDLLSSPNSSSKDGMNSESRLMILEIFLIISKDLSGLKTLTEFKAESFFIALLHSNTLETTNQMKILLVKVTSLFYNLTY